MTRFQWFWLIVICVEIVVLVAASYWRFVIL